MGCGAYEGRRAALVSATADAGARPSREAGPPPGGGGGSVSIRDAPPRPSPCGQSFASQLSVSRGEGSLTAPPLSDPDFIVGKK